MKKYSIKRYNDHFLSTTVSYSIDVEAPSAEDAVVVLGWISGSNLGICQSSLMKDGSGIEVLAQNGNRFVVSEVR